MFTAHTIADYHTIAVADHKTDKSRRTCYSCKNEIVPGCYVYLDARTVIGVNKRSETVSCRDCVEADKTWANDNQKKAKLWFVAHPCTNKCKVIHMTYGMTHDA